MTKLIAILLTFALCLSLCACGAEPAPEMDEDPIDEIIEETTEETGPDPLVLYDEAEDYCFINQERVGEIMESVELTTDNWADYIGVCTFTKEIVTKDTFGEVISEISEPHTVLGARQERYYHLRDFAIELQDKATGETRIIEGQFEELDEGFDLSRYDCTRIKGTIYFLDVPEEAIWESDQSNGDADIRVRGFTVRYADIGYGPPMGYLLWGYAMDGFFHTVLY